MGKIENREQIPYNGYEQLKAFAASGSEVQVGTVVYRDDARIPPVGNPVHEEDEYVYIIRGGLKFGVGDEVRELHEGDFHYLPKGTAHWCSGIGENGEFMYILVK